MRMLSLQSDEAVCIPKCPIFQLKRYCAVNVEDLIWLPPEYIKGLVMTLIRPAAVCLLLEKKIQNKISLFRKISQK